MKIMKIAKTTGKVIASGLTDKEVAKTAGKTVGKVLGNAVVVGLTYQVVNFMTKFARDKAGSSNDEIIKTVKRFKTYVKDVEDFDDEDDI